MDNTAEEIRRYTEAIQRLAENDDFKLVMARSREAFKVDQPSAIIADFNTNKTMHYDGSRAVFSHFDKSIAGDYLKQAQATSKPSERDEFLKQNAIE